ncbi:hypothetical protein CLAFUW4_02149 [Fulvia fulva]|uniref:Uncharacterized protein n=1 Tax=Passalora fulva TaxID=5499 RepID=A0A9Q8L6W2_PASFU|nr:uncharacterized protein CLAFUR5_02140 [Fulvia fulva]KAK4634017.1 hypothetical protein CLAFUR4_02145 [Fulvia fulva]KAK4638126.1 hypothetical protein CLAFUR0_02148 [Fulvia fulva]UJO11844.1 hypothetical protein CLAFUR5_02140 [Fulvia fulva]WPV10100.1 hypothetical protein CLAFUW4_02149 [Fulvia fulva]WPV24800.1 hypothetical protein CLAFUW7_02149 [Fulvia fulva]
MLSTNLPFAALIAIMMLLQMSSACTSNAECADPPIHTSTAFTVQGLLQFASQEASAAEGEDVLATEVVAQVELKRDALFAIRFRSWMISQDLL